MKITFKKLFKGMLACTALLSFSTGFAQYCATAASNCGLDDEIQTVSFAGINNSSVCSAGGYADYTAGTGASVIAGMPYTLEVTVGPGGNEAVGVWIDYNQNQVFDTDEFTFVGNETGGFMSVSVAIPASATAGVTRMRIRNFYVAAGDPTTVYSTTANSSCATISTGYGETEDYTVTIIAGTDCDGTPSVGDATASITDACAGQSFSLNAVVTPLAAGLSYQWQSSTDGGANWINLGASQTQAGYTVADQAVATSYRVIVTCTASNQTATSTPVSVGQNAASECYCTNAIDFICSDGDVITNVTIGNFNNASDCPVDETGYSDYSGLGAAEMTAGEANPVTVSVGPSGDGWLFESVGMWVDYNQNGNFEDEEYTYVGTGLNETLSASIAVPATALNGNTKLRVVVAASTAVAFSSAYKCGPLTEDNAYGEMEDYLVNITGGLASKSFQSAQASVFPNPTNGLVSIRLNNDTLQSATVFNVTGQQVLSQAYGTQSDNYTLNMQQLPSGVYMLKLNGASGTYSRKLIKN